MRIALQYGDKRMAATEEFRQYLFTAENNDNCSFFSQLECHHGIAQCNPSLAMINLKIKQNSP
jgi:hypothetical protein